MLLWAIAFLPLLSLPQFILWGLCQLLAPRNRPLHVGATVWLLDTNVLFLDAVFVPAVAKRFEAVMNVASRITQSALHLFDQVGDGGFLILFSGPALYAFPIAVVAALVKWLS